MQVPFVWTPNTESNVSGYKLYVGRTHVVATSSGSITEVVNVGNVLEYTYTIPEVPASNGNWYFARKAYNSSLVESTGFSPEVVISFQLSPGLDIIPPSVVITSPTVGSTYATDTSPLALMGTASDNVGVTHVIWSNSRGGGGTAAGTNQWGISGIILKKGNNTITVTAMDAAGNTGSDVLVVSYKP